MCPFDFRLKNSKVKGHNALITEMAIGTQLLSLYTYHENSLTPIELKLDLCDKNNLQIN